MSTTTPARLSDTRLYTVWQGMLGRCYTPSSTSYPIYGGRGITVCDEWRTFALFAVWALAAGYTDDLSIDRIDNDGNYEPRNCRWCDRITQANNTRQNVYVTAWGETKSATEWSRDPRAAVAANVIAKRVHAGVMPERAICLPANAPTFAQRNNGASGLLGVHFHTQSGRWQACIKNRYLGIYAEKDDAARAYDRAAMQEWGKWAVVNFPEDWPDPLKAPEDAALPRAA